MINSKRIRNYLYYLFVISITPFFLLILNSCSKDSLESLYSYQIIDVDSNLSYNSSYIVVFGDIQNYMSPENISFYRQSLSWIYSQKIKGHDIPCVIELGDITNSNTTEEWSCFYNSTRNLTDIVPFFFCVGNHDYDWDKDGLIHDRSSTKINDYYNFPMSQKYIVERYEENANENIIAKVNIGASPIYLLILEYGPRVEVVDWAMRQVESSPEKKFILITHEYLTRDGQLDEVGTYAKLQFTNTPTTWTSPKYLWDNLVKTNNNILGVVCGHNGFFANLWSQNDYGREIPQMLFNLQYLDNGGDGWIELWEIPNGSNTVNVRLYNTITRSFYEDKSFNFFLNY